jgi:hypothetical protein
MAREAYDDLARKYKAGQAHGLAIQKFTNSSASKRGRLMFMKPLKKDDASILSSTKSTIAQTLWQVFGRELPMTSGPKAITIRDDLHERQCLHVDNRIETVLIRSETKRNLLRLGPFHYGWSAFGGLRDGQGLCFPDQSTLNAGTVLFDTDLDPGFAKFQGIKNGDLMLILGSTVHGGGAHSSVESGLDVNTVNEDVTLDVKFFIDCPGQGYPTNPFAGTVIKQQMYLDTQLDSEHAEYLSLYGSYTPSFHFY